MGNIQIVPTESHSRTEVNISRTQSVTGESRLQNKVRTSGIQEIVSAGSMDYDQIT